MQGQKETYQIGRNNNKHLWTMYNLRASSLLLILEAKGTAVFGLRRLQSRERHTLSNQQFERTGRGGYMTLVFQVHHQIVSRLLISTTPL